MTSAAKSGEQIAIPRGSPSREILSRARAFEALVFARSRIVLPATSMGPLPGVQQRLASPEHDLGRTRRKP
jgi:hypothetical protein